MNTHYKSGEGMGDYLAEPWTSFTKQSFMALPVAEEIQVAILVVSLMNLESLSAIAVALKTLEHSKATWRKVGGKLVKEHRSKKLC